MSYANYAIDKVLGMEGGYSNDPKDRGGETIWGITEAVARAYGYMGDMKLMSRDQARVIYRLKYWQSNRLDEIAAFSFDVAFEIFDTGVNQGEATGVRYFQRALNVLNKQGTLYYEVVVDGRMGPMTIAAFKEYMRGRGGEGAKVMLKALNCLQGAKYIGIAEADPSQERFVYGWLQHRVS